jgi:hypothetical protein
MMGSKSRGTVAIYFTSFISLRNCIDVMHLLSNVNIPDSMDLN